MMGGVDMSDAYLVSYCNTRKGFKKVLPEALSSLD
jgi:hypothetical protein